MNEELQKQLVRQLKILNFWITAFGSLILIVLVILGFLVWKVVSFTNQTRDQISDLKTSISKTTDIKSDICSGSNSVGDFLKDKTSYCKE